MTYTQQNEVCKDWYRFSVVVNVLKLHYSSLRKSLSNTTFFEENSHTGPENLRFFFKNKFIFETIISYR